MLKFSPANAKLVKLEKKTGKLYSFSMLSGHNCPFAKDCLSRAVKQNDGTMKIVDGKDTVFRCFSASQEVLFPAVYAQRKHNQDAIRSCKNDRAKMREMILEALPLKSKVIRIHIGADFITANYFRAWCDVARLTPNVLFYAYTKSLRFWVADRDYIPENMVLTASRGGLEDSLISQHNLREAVVVFSEAEAAEKGLAIDTDDSHAALPELRNKSFALLIHGVQPKGSEAGKAVRELNGVGSYRKE